MVTHKFLLEPRDLWWEENGLRSPAVAEFSGKKYMLFSAIGRDNLTRIGLAVSEDGEHFERFEVPLLEGDELSVYERLGIVSPRITKVGHDYCIVYAGLSVYSFTKVISPGQDVVPWRSRISMVTTRDFRTFSRHGVVLKDLDCHDPVLFPVKIQGNYWLIHRIGKGVHVSVSPNIRHWSGGYQLFEPKESWEEGGIAPACAPIEIEEGWLLFYNGRDKNDTSRVGAVLLDRHNPAFITRRTKKPLMEATEPWERAGSNKKGIVLAGAIRQENEVYLYYGSGANAIGLGKLPLDAVLQSLGAGSGS